MGPTAGFAGGFCLLCVLSLVAVDGAAWELVHSEPGLQVRQRPRPGTPVNEIQGVLGLRATLGELVALLRDADYNRQWVYRSGGAEILKEEGLERAWVYGIVDAPWPMADRDTVVRFDFSQDPVSRIIDITISNAPDFVPQRSGLVRVPDFGGFWRLEPGAAGEVTVTYQVYGNPGGWVPVWAANYAAVTSVIRTLQNMGPAVDRYRGASPSRVAD